LTGGPDRDICGTEFDQNLSGAAMNDLSRTSDLIAGIVPARLTHVARQARDAYAAARPRTQKALAKGSTYLSGRCADALDERLAHALSDAGTRHARRN
jgi:hypothetical protein